MTQRAPKPSRWLPNRSARLANLSFQVQRGEKTPGTRGRAKSLTCSMRVILCMRPTTKRMQPAQQVERTSTIILRLGLFCKV
eukprot:8418114-Karenia_brevis.AAC.1